MRQHAGRPASVRPSTTSRRDGHRLAKSEPARRTREAGRAKTRPPPIITRAAAYRVICVDYVGASPEKKTLGEK